MASQTTSHPLDFEKVPTIVRPEGDRIDFDAVQELAAVRLRNDRSDAKLTLGELDVGSRQEQFARTLHLHARLSAASTSRSPIVIAKPANAQL